MLEGNLTIKDSKNNISFPVTYTLDGNTMSIKSEPFTIDRTKWNVNYGSKSVLIILEINSSVMILNLP